MFGGTGRRVAGTKEVNVAANKVIERMRRGEKALGLSLSFYTDELIELAGLMGLDFVNFDGQHSPTSPETIDRFCRMCDGWGVTPSMRVPDQIPSNILNYIDRGVQVITVPDVENKAQAEALVQACFFAPIGRRSFTSPRIIRYGLEGDAGTRMRETNENMLVMPQIENITAYRNLDEILTVPGLEVFAGGPNDLAQSMGYPGEPEHPECLRVTEEGTAKIHAAGKLRSDDVTVDVAATATIQDAIAKLLQENGR
jgi:4-hydroxy-2-oxoheptanedioate aldolase